MTYRVGSTAQRLSRRRLLVSGGSTLLATSTVGCDLLSSDPASDQDNRQSGEDGNEAPMLAQRVEADDLPPVEERLPNKPLVIEPTTSPGRYGGTWHSWLQGAGGTYIFMTQVGYENLVRWDPEWTEVIPNLAESWEIRNDGEEYIFHLREGIKWSDGQPFTADDLVFAYNDVLLNSDLYPEGAPGLFTVEQTPATLQRIDDYTVRFTFSSPNGLFLDELARPGRDLYVPRHYMMEFHKNYNDDADNLADDEGFDNWADLFLARNDLEEWQNPDRPVLDAWIVVQPLGQGVSGADFERNPYYWKTDPDGRQLPYLDEISYQSIDDLETALLKATNGEFDLNVPTQAATICTTANKPVLARNRENGGYAFLDATHAGVNQMVIMFNLTHQDPNLRDLFQNRDFRIGLSYAINREEVINTVFQRQGVPWQAAPREESDFYHEELAKQYTEYDVDQANTHLDQAGYTERDQDDFRLRPDGERISFTIETVTEQPDRVNALELVKEYWRDVGADMHIQIIDRTLFFERTAGNQHDAIVWGGAGGLRDAILTPGVYFPAGAGSRFAIPWANWYSSGGAEGEEPPEPAKQQMQLYDQAAGSVGEEQQHDFFMQLLDIAQEQFWIIGTSLPVGAYGTVKDDFGNGPTWVADTYTYSSEGPTRPEQYYRISES